MTQLSIKYAAFLPMLALGLFLAACDSDEDTISDADLFVDTWQVSQVIHADTTVALTNFSSLTVSFTQSDLSIQGTSQVDGVPDVDISGKYSVNEATKQVSINLEVAPVPFTATYSFANNDDQLTLTIPGWIAQGLGDAFGTEFSEDVRLTMTRS